MRKFTLLVAYLVLLMLVLFQLAYPLQFVVAPADNDTSYPYLLLLARNQGLQFGLDLFTTFGPFGWIYSRIFWPDGFVYTSRLTFWILIAAWIIFASTIFLRRSYGLAVLFLLGVFLSNASPDPVLYFPDGFFLMLCLLPPALGLVLPWKSRTSWYFLGIGSSILYATLVLVKGTLVFPALLGVVITTGVYWLRSKIIAVFSALIFCAVTAIIYVGLCAQSADSFFQYLQGVLLISSSYAWGMQREDTSELTNLLPYTFLSCWILWTLHFGGKSRSDEKFFQKEYLIRLTVIILYYSACFIAWKHYDTRQTSTLIAFLAASAALIPMLRNCSEKFKTGRLYWLTVIPLLIATALSIFSQPAVRRTETAKFLAGVRGIVNPTSLFAIDRRLSNEFEEMRSKLRLDGVEELLTTSSSVGILGDFEGLGLLHGWPLQLPPVPEAAHAASVKLQKLNQDAIRQSPPDVIVLNYAHRREHLPVQSNALWFKAFLEMYSYRFTEDGFDVYALRQPKEVWLATCEDWALFTSSNTIAINRPNAQEFLSITIDYPYNAISTLRSIFGKKSGLYVKLHLNDGSTWNYPINLQALPTPIILSPYFQNTEDIRSHFNQTPKRWPERVELLPTADSNQTFRFKFCRHRPANG